MRAVTVLTSPRLRERPEPPEWTSGSVEQTFVMNELQEYVTEHRACGLRNTINTLQPQQGNDYRETEDLDISMEQEEDFKRDDHTEDMAEETIAINKEDH
ncbi:hypothetical protein DPMN_136788 [Dreissena polymorpha]|uniref:Uncharacterized protein n=1 Tax=Dreissena polymorpha TaxID=45954 RepID=A0A9D4G0I2_DREPO|nr:hypothetical protein DPMN_136788 [Dreissena polymorpha]